MKITITPEMLCELLAPEFTFEACEAICDFFDECGPDTAPLIGDIAISFSEIAAEYVEDEEQVMIYLDNGNAVIFN